MTHKPQHTEAASRRRDDRPLVLTAAHHAAATQPGDPIPGVAIPDGAELISRRAMTAAEAAVVISFLVVGAVLLAVGQPITSILGLFAGVGAVVVAVLARRVPKITWR